MTKMSINNKKILATSLITTIILVTAFTFIAPQAQPAYAGFPSVSDIANAAASKVKDLLEPLFDIIENLLDDVLGELADTDFGLEALDDLLEDTDFGLEALDTLLEDTDFGLEQIDDQIEEALAALGDADFGLDAQTNDPDYGLKAIDDEVEFIGDKTLQQLSKQEVDITAKKANRMIYLQTTESGKTVDVDFLSVELITGTVMTPLVPGDVITKISGTTGLYLLDIGSVRNVDSVFIEVQHPESPIIHATLSPGPVGTPVDHFGSTLITPQGTSGGK